VFYPVCLECPVQSSLFRDIFEFVPWRGRHVWNAVTYKWQSRRVASWGRSLCPGRYTRADVETISVP